MTHEPPKHPSHSPQQSATLLRVLRWLLVYPLFLVVALLLIFALPIVGNFAYFGVEEVLDLGDHCLRTSEGFPVNCTHYGLDVSALTTGYKIGLFLAGIGNPILAWEILTTYIPGPLFFCWCVVAIFIFIKSLHPPRKQHTGD